MKHPVRHGPADGERATRGRGTAGVSPASFGGVSPPVPTRGETPRELAGETPAVPYVGRRRSAAFACAASASSPRRLHFTPPLKAAHPR